MRVSYVYDYIIIRQLDNGHQLNTDGLTADGAKACPLNAG